MAETRGPYSVKPPVGEMDPAAFERWLRPAAAIKILEPILSEREAKKEIYRRVCEGEVLCVARTSNWYGGEGAGITIRDYSRLGSFLWQFNAPPQDYDLLWKTGTHTFQWITGPRETKLHNVQAFGIRFDPAGVQAILVDAGLGGPQTATPEPEPESRRDLPPLPDGLLKKWHELFVMAYPKGTITLAQTSIEGMFPKHWVSRKRLRELFPDAQRGRPKENN